MEDPFVKKQEPSSVVNESNKSDESDKSKPEYMKILEQYGGLESNIPINSPYWKIRP